MQWHPLFAHLLRPLVQDYYDVQTDVSVGDLPREADIVLLRRTTVQPTPFQSIWRHLTEWNVLEFKGPTVDPRLHDPDLLIEVALGVERRLNEAQQRQGQTRRPRNEVSLWYVANHVGRFFRAEVEQILRQSLEPLGEGLWRCPCLGRWLFVVSNDELPVDPESVPLHLVSHEPESRVRELVQQVAAEPRLWRVYGAWLSFLYPELAEEIEQMAKAMKSPLEEKEFDLTRAIEYVGIRKVIKQLGLKRVLEELGPEQLLQELTPELLAGLSPDQREELKRRLQ